jgi:hypothetical protein
MNKKYRVNENEVIENIDSDKTSMESVTRQGDIFEALDTTHFESDVFIFNRPHRP